MTTNTPQPDPTTREVPDAMDALVRAMRLIADDCSTDATTSEGAPFTGKEIGRRLGEIYAMISNVAKGVSALAALEKARGGK